ncbi:hypothetical protein BH24GEM3_BH24GEM3_25490 [soil metagenome]
MHRRALIESAPALSPTLAPRGELIDRALARVSDAELRLGNRLVLLRDGRETYVDWLTAIAGAQRWVHLENYIFLDDKVGHLFADALAERAAAGVPVRVLVDWFGSMSVGRSFWKRLRGEGVEVRIVNPPAAGTPLQSFKRDHRKLLAVDGSYGSVGGVCIGEKWLERSPVTDLPFRDTAVSVRGPAVAELERAFASMWDLQGDPLPAEERPRPEEIPVAGDEAARVIIQDPGRLQILRVLQLLAAGIERRFWIADAYFLSVPSLTESLLAAARDGVDVRVLLPSTSDIPLIGPLSRAGYRPLLEAGVRIWEYSGLMMHAKTSVADGWWSRVGSTNLNIAGLWMNWEIDLVVEDRRFAAEMEAMFLEDLAEAREIRLHPGRRRPRVHPERPRTRAERQAQRKIRRPGQRTAASLARLGGAAFGGGEESLRRHERMIEAAVSGSVLGLSLLGAGFPRLLAWPIAVVGGVVGAAGVVRVLRPPEPRKSAVPAALTP